MLRVVSSEALISSASRLEMQKKARSSDDDPAPTPVPAPKPAAESTRKAISGVMYLSSVGAAFVLGTFFGIAAVLFFRG